MFLHLNDREERVQKMFLVQDASEKSLIHFTTLFWPQMHAGWDEDGKAIDPLIRTKVGDCILTHLEAVTLGQIETLVINVHPGLGKTKYVFHSWFAWELGPKRMANLDRGYIGATSKFAVEENNKFRAFIRAEPYSTLWDVTSKVKDFSADTFVELKDTNDFFVTANTAEQGFRGFGTVKALGVDTQLTGKRLERIVLDDLNPPKDAESAASLRTVERFYKETLPSRKKLGSKHYSEVIIQQRVARGDLTDVVRGLGIDAVYLTLPATYNEDRIVYSPLAPSCPPKDGMCGRVNWAPKLDVSKTVEESPILEYALAADGFSTTKGAEMSERQRKEFDGIEIKWLKGFRADWRDETNPLLAPELLTQSQYDLIKMKTGGEASFGWCAQYEQSPVHRESGVFDVGKIVVMGEDEVPKHDGMYVRAWDIAYGMKDKTVSVKGFVDRSGKFYVLHCSHWNKPSGDCESSAKQLVNLLDGINTEQSVPQDPGAGGKANVSAWRTNFTGHPSISRSESGSKLVKASPLASAVNLGNVRMVRADWNQPLTKAMAEFTSAHGGSGPHDDFIDACAACYNRSVVRSRADSEGCFLPMFIK